MTFLLYSSLALEYIVFQFTQEPKTHMYVGLKPHEAQPHGLNWCQVQLRLFNLVLIQLQI